MNLDDPVVMMIRREMRKKGVNAEKMADGIYVNRSTFYKRLNLPETIRLDELRSMAKYLDLDIGVLARGIRWTKDHF